MSFGREAPSRRRSSSIEPFPFAASLSSPPFRSIPYLGDEHLNGLDVLLGGGDAESHDSLEDLAIEVERELKIKEKKRVSQEVVEVESLCWRAASDDATMTFSCCRPACSPRRRPIVLLTERAS